MRVIDIRCDYDWNRENQCKCNEYQKEEEGKLCEFTLARGFKYFCELKIKKWGIKDESSFGLLFRSRTQGI